MICHIQFFFYLSPLTFAVGQRLKNNINQLFSPLSRSLHLYNKIILIPEEPHDFIMAVEFIICYIGVFILAIIGSYYNSIIPVLLQEVHSLGMQTNPLEDKY